LLLDLLGEWTNDTATRDRILVDNAATLYGFGN
jgi:predicted TIM-barrel fold metal-dependent hydrolase